MATGKGVVKGKSRDVELERRWRRVMVEQRRSGLNVREFCRRGKLAESSFHYWRRELSRRQAELSRGRQAESSQGSQAMPFQGQRAEPSRRCQAERLARGSAKSPSRRRVRRSARSSSPSFVAVRVAKAGGFPGNAGDEAVGAGVAGGAIEIALACGRRLRVAGPVDRGVLADVVSVLEGLPVAASAGAVAASMDGAGSTVDSRAGLVHGGDVGGREVSSC